MPAPPEIARILDAAQTAHDRRDWATAATLYGEYRAHVGDDPNLLIALGDVQTESGDLPSAREAYEAAEQQGDPRAAARLHQLARTPTNAPRGLDPSAPPRADSPDLMRRLDAPLATAFEGAGLALRERPLSARERIAQTEAPERVSVLKTLRLTLSPGETPKLIVAVPVYRAEHLIPDLLSSLVTARDELIVQRALVLLINDSPGYAPLEAALRHAESLFKEGVSYGVVENGENLGFIHASNIGMLLARECACHCLLFNSDARLTPGALAEIAAVAASDPLISVVSPRSNNATLCNSPYPEKYRSLGPEAAVAAHAGIARLLPRVTYTPTAVGFCLWIKAEVLVEFGVLDPVYGKGYNEENDFVMRCNRAGYSAAIANRAFVLHVGGESFAVQSSSSVERDRQNALILQDRYPEYPRAVARYFAGSEYRAQVLTAGLLPDCSGRFSLLFDCTHVGDYHNGTSEHATRLMSAFLRVAGGRFRCYVACNHATLLFHGWDRLDGLSYAWGAQAQLAPFAVAFRIGQPFSRDAVVALARLAPIAGFLMLDSIAIDSQHLDDNDARELWREVFATSEIVGYNSRFTRDQFHRRFHLPPRLVEFDGLCATSLEEYGDVTRHATRGRHILLVGNKFEHKNLRRTLALLRASEHGPVVVLGVEGEDGDGIRFVPSGYLDAAALDRLYAEATCILYPSFYEGFGLPVVHALRFRRPVVARDLPVFREIQDASNHRDNIRLYASTREMVDAALEGPAWVESRGPARQEVSWLDSARALEAAIDQAIGRFSYPELLDRVVRFG